MAKPKPTKMLAVLGRCRRSGRLNLVPRSSALALFGSCHLDMQHATVDGDNFKMSVTVLFGSATFVLPEGAEVKPSGAGLFATSSVDVPEHVGQSGLPTLEIEWFAAFGRIRILDSAQLQALLADDEPDDDMPPPPTAADRIPDEIALGLGGLAGADATSDWSPIVEPRPDQQVDQALGEVSVATVEPEVGLAPIAVAESEPAGGDLFAPPDNSFNTEPESADAAPPTAADLESAGPPLFSDEPESAAPPMPGDSELESAAPPVPGDDELESAAPPVPGDELESAAPPVPGDDELESAAPPVPGDDELESAAPLVPGEDELESAAPPVPGDESQSAASLSPGDELESAAPPVPGDDELESAAPPVLGDEPESAAPPVPGDDELESAAPPVPGDDELESAAPPVLGDEPESAAPPVPGDELESAAPLVPGDDELESAAPPVPSGELESAAPRVPGDDELESAAPPVSGDELEFAAPVVPGDEELESAAPPVQGDDELESAAPPAPGDEELEGAGPISGDDEPESAAPPALGDKAESAAPATTTDVLGLAASSVPVPGDEDLESAAPPAPGDELESAAQAVADDNLESAAPPLPGEGDAEFNTAADDDELGSAAPPVQADSVAVDESVESAASETDDESEFGVPPLTADGEAVEAAAHPSLDDELETTVEDEAEAEAEEEAGTLDLADDDPAVPTPVDGVNEHTNLAEHVERNDVESDESDDAVGSGDAVDFAASDESAVVEGADETRRAGDPLDEPHRMDLPGLDSLNDAAGESHDAGEFEDYAHDEPPSTVERPEPAPTALESAVRQEVLAKGDHLDEVNVEEETDARPLDKQSHQAAVVIGPNSFSPATSAPASSERGWSVVAVDAIQPPPEPVLLTSDPYSKDDELPVVDDELPAAKEPQNHDAATRDRSQQTDGTDVRYGRRKGDRPLPSDASDDGPAAGPAADADPASTDSARDNMPSVAADNESANKEASDGAPTETLTT